MGGGFNGFVNGMFEGEGLGVKTWSERICCGAYPKGAWHLLEICRKRDLVPFGLPDLEGEEGGGLPALGFLDVRGRPVATS